MILTDFPKKAVWLALIVISCLISPLLAGGGPPGFVVLYDPTDAVSVTLANHYQQVRQIPERNMIPYPKLALVNSRESAWELVYFLRGELEARGLLAQLQGIALVGNAPVGTWPMPTGQHDSLQSFLYKSPNYGHANYPAFNYALNNAFPQNYPAEGPAPTVALTASKLFSGAKYWPVSLVASPGRGAMTFEECMDYMDRAASRDGSKARGTIYWPLNGDIRSRTRQPQLAGCQAVWGARGIAHNVASGDWVVVRDDVIGGIVGAAAMNTRLGNSYLPGAWVDHLTSAGGYLNSLVRDQTVCTDWIRAGADGTSGTVQEPFAISAKFPNAHIHTHLRAGSSMVEAFWQSIAQPQEILCVADPLLQPHADFPIVQISSPVEGATLSGSQMILAAAAPTGDKVLESEMDLFIDGRRIVIGSSDEAVGATRVAGGFQLDTTTLGDGWHELRVVAYNADSVRTQGESKLTFRVNNAGRAVAFSGPAIWNRAAGGSFQVIPEGINDVQSLTIRANGRTVANLPPQGGSILVPGAVGPLKGNWLVTAVATRANGEQIWSNPLSIPVSSPAPLPAADGATPDVALADIRYFASTTAPGFNWETTAPTTITTYAGVNSQFNLTPSSALSNPITWPPTDGSGQRYPDKPGMEISFWFLAPVEDWYEFANDIPYYYGDPTADFVSFEINGQEPPNFYNDRGPVRLSAGWHSVRIRTVIGYTNWTYGLWTRGGYSKNFERLNTSRAASNFVGGISTVPVIHHATGSPANVTGTTATLEASATVNGGDPALLTYTWNLVSGPEAVTFSPNGTQAASTTTATFARAGNYVFQVTVRGPGGTATAQTNTIQVHQTLAGMWFESFFSTIWQGGKLSLFAFNYDQFSQRIDYSPINPTQPTVAWSCTDPNATFVPLDATGTKVVFGTNASNNVVVTATGVNGRPGSRMITLTPVVNTPPTISAGPTYSNTDPTGLISFFVNASDPNDSSGVYLQYRWEAVSAPPGGSLVFLSNTASTTRFRVNGAGTYTIRATVIDGGGASAASTVTFDVPQSGNYTPPPTVNNYTFPTTVFVGDQLALSGYSNTATQYQWQMSTDSGSTWQDLMEETSSTGFYGPVTLADSGRRFRLKAINEAGFGYSAVSTLTVSNPAGGIIGFASGTASSQIGENESQAIVTLTRRGSTTGAVSATYTLVNGTATLGTHYRGVDGASQVTGTVTWADGDNSPKTITVPLIDNTHVTNSQVSFRVNLSAPTGGALLAGTHDVYAGLNQHQVWILDDDGPGFLQFLKPNYTTNENDAAVTLAVQRTFSSRGSLTANYVTNPGTALANRDFTAVSGSLTWADGDSSTKFITVPIRQNRFIAGDIMFTVSLSGASTDAATVTISDTPFEQWQKQWWGSAISTPPKFASYQQGITGLNAFLQYRLNELTGTTFLSSGANSAPGIRVDHGGSLTLARPGPQPPDWLSMATDNTAVRFSAAGLNSSRFPDYAPEYEEGSSILLGNAGGFSAQLLKGWTLIAFVKTTVTDRVMSLVGSRNFSTLAQFQVTLNQAFNNPRSVTPDNLRVTMIADDGSGQWDYSVPLTGLPGGKLTDGLWHQIVITCPPMTSGSSDHPRFYFDGVEVDANKVWGRDAMDATRTITQFDSGLRLGAGGHHEVTRFFDGEMDDVAFFAAQLSSSDIAALRQASDVPQAIPVSATAEADANNDGITNLLAYSLNRDPFENLANATPFLTIEDDRLVLNFQRWGAHNDVILSVEASSDLVDWSEIWNSSTDESLSRAPVLESLAVSDFLDLSDPGSTSRFLRLKLKAP